MKLPINHLLEVRSDDPETGRRARLLNVCLLAVGVAAAVLLVVNLADYTFSGDELARRLAAYAALSLLGSAGIYWLNRHGRHRPAGYLFLALIILIITFATRPAIYLFEGSTILAYVLPIIMASVILEPWTSFAVTTVIAVLLLVAAKTAGLADEPSPETIATLYMLAVVAWLSARSLSQALRRTHDRATDLRQMNEELDRRVAERTQDLQQINRQLEDALQRERAESSKNQAILESIADGVIVFDHERRAIIANPAVAGIMGQPVDQLLGRTIHELVGVTEESETGAQIATAFAPDASAPVRLTFPVGAQIIAASLAPVFLSGESIRGVAAVFHDVTKEVEADRAKSEFVSTVSHELRTPLTSIKGYADLLYMGAVGAPNDEQRRFLQIIKSNADRLTALLSDLLDISRIETGRIRLDLRDIALADVVSDVVASLMPEIRNKGLQISLDIAPDLPLVRGDRSRLVQVMNNLLSNAYRYTPAGGQIRVSVSQTNDTLRVDVSDTGIGISLKDQAKLFQRFHRADDPRVREVSGTGLGLAITKMFVELHGGRIWVESQLNKGSTFTFVLPAIRPPEAAAKAPARPAKRRRVLVVEDDDNIADLIRHHLEGDDYQVMVEARGQNVLPRVLADHPDVITLDILLPDMDGFDVLRQLKDDPATAGIPVIVLSVLQDHASGLRLGAADYLTKPIRGEDLLRSVRRAFGELQPHERPTILVVDDEPDVRQWLRDALTMHGFHVAEAVDGIDALTQVRRTAPRLILLDLKMPRLDGYGVIKRLKADPATSHIPIVVLTAVAISRESEKVRLLDMGATRFLTKPISVESLVAEIREQLAAAIPEEAEGA